MEPGKINDRIQALERVEQAVLQPIVEGELVLRAEEMCNAYQSLTAACGSDDVTSPPTGDQQQARVEDAAREEQRLQAQSRELLMAARRLRDRAVRVEPDEKQLGDEVDTLVSQTRQFTVDFRKHEEGRRAAATSQSWSAGKAR